MAVTSDGSSLYSAAITVLATAAGMAASAALSAYAKWAREKAVASCSSNK